MTTWKGKYRSTNTQNIEKGSENSYQKLKRSQWERHMYTHRNLIEIFRQARPSFSYLVRVFTFLSLILCFSYFGTFLSTWFIIFLKLYISIYNFFPLLQTMYEYIIVSIKSDIPFSLYLFFTVYLSLLVLKWVVCFVSKMDGICWLDFGYISCLQ